MTRAQLAATGVDLLHYVPEDAFVARFQNVRLALSMAGRGYVLESGRLAIEGDATTLINSPEVRRIFLGG